jgi:large repetitive protein
MHFNNIAATTQICSGCADGNLAAGTFCYDVNNSVWFTFTTNSLGGNADVSISNLSCLTGAGVDTELEASVFSASTPCDPATYNILQCTSTSFSGAQVINLTGLLPNTVYYVHIDGDDVGSGITSPAECDFDIEVSGPAVEPEINTTITAASCAANDGQIVVNSVVGAGTSLQYSLNGGVFQVSNTFTGLAAGIYTLEITSSNGCSYSTQITVPLTGGPQDGTPVTVDATCGIADGQLSINAVTGGTGPYTYTLDSGTPQVSNSFTGLNAGTYDVTVTDATGCSFTYENISVASNASITSAVYTITQPTCDLPTGTIIVAPVGGTGPYTFSLNGGAPVGSGTFSGLLPGTYSVQITDNGGCTFTDAEIILVVPTQDQTAQISISPSTVSICQGDAVTFNAIYSNGGTLPNIQWQVNGVNAGTGDVSFSTTTLNNGDVVTCILTSSDPCVNPNVVVSNNVTVNVTSIVNPTVTIVSDASSVCIGDVVTYTAATTNCTTNGTYSWFVNGSLVSSDTLGVYAQAMMSTAEVICTFTCNDPCATIANSNSLDIDVTIVSADAGPNQLIGEGDATQLEGSGTGTYSWSPTSTLDDPSSPTPVASPEQTTTYTLTVTNNGCTATDEVTIVVTELIVAPNTFTPNGDEVNDVWHISRIENYPSCKVTIYDRWGQKVFNSTGYTNENAWDGKYLGQPLPAAAYYYVIELNAANTKDGDSYYGWVAIVY